MVLSSVAWPFIQGPPFTVPGEVILCVIKGSKRKPSLRRQFLHKITSMSSAK